MGKGIGSAYQGVMRRPPHILMLFLDGVGIGRKNSKVNPFFATKLEAMNELMGGTAPHLRDAHHVSSSVSLRPINATLGVAGLPQSGTGQTALLTGINAPKFIGKHFGPYPYSSLKPVIGQHNIFRMLASRGHSVMYANAFPRQYFEYISSPKTRMTAISMSWSMSGYAFNDANALAKGEALSADITNKAWGSKLGYPDITTVTAQEAGQRFVALGKKHDFVLFEYYLTDHAGHSQSMEEAVSVLQTLDHFLEGVLSVFEHDSMLLVVTSDHGNIEDLSTKSHTRNPVPLLCVGSRHEDIFHRVRNLTHVAPAIINILQ